MSSFITLVLGGAASGKSAYAEKLVTATGAKRIYLATAQAFDAEMRAKIDAHRKSRGDGWTTIESPLDVASSLAARTQDEVVLLDCATLWLTNVILADLDLSQAEDELVEALTSCAAKIVIVSNEVGQGIIPDNALARRFQTAQGKLNQRLAALSGTVIFVTAGLPTALKGASPA